NGIQLTPNDATATGANNNTIDGNLIAGNGLAGVLLTNFNSIIGTTGSGVIDNRLTGNSIYNNGGLGIDLGGSGVPVLNDSSGHVGPNDFQNFPVLTAAEWFAGSKGSSYLVSGTLNSAANTTFTID